MANKTIPELNAISEVDGSTLIPVDSGIQSYKCTAQVLADGLAKLRNQESVFVNENYVITDDDHEKVLLVDSSAGNTMEEGDPLYPYYVEGDPVPGPLVDMELPAFGDPVSGFLKYLIINLPDDAPRVGFRVTIKDAGKKSDGNSFEAKKVCIMPGELKARSTSAYTIEQIGPEYEDAYTFFFLDKAGGSYDLSFDGTRWWLVSNENFRFSGQDNKVIYKTSDFTAENGKTYLIDSTVSGAVLMTLPPPQADMEISFKDAKGNAGTINIGVACDDAGEFIDQHEGGHNFDTNWGSWTLKSNGIDWFIF